MSLADWFHRGFLDVEHAAEDVIHFVEKEINMTVSDIVAAIKAALGRASDAKTADAQTISGLQQQVSDANTARDAAVAASNAKDAQIADLTQQLGDATTQLTDLLNQALQVAPDPTAPAQ